MIIYSRKVRDRVRAQPVPETWEEMPRDSRYLLDGLQEADFTPRLHPRNRRGEFIDVPDLHVDHAPGGLDFGRPTAESAVPMPAPEIDSAIAAKVKDVTSATAYLKTLGVKGEFGDYKAKSPFFWQEIAQATHDATKRYPVLAKGGRYGKLKRIAFMSQVQDEFREGWDSGPETEREYAEGIWATTTIGLKESGRTGIPNVGPPEGNDVDILINDDLNNEHPPAGSGLSQNPSIEDEGTKQDPFSPPGSNSTAPPDRWVYGRLMHELGHAVAQVSGMEFDSGPDPSESEGLMENLLRDADLSPSDLEAFSMYGAHQTGEAWAEIFTTLNTAGADKHVTPALMTKFKKLRKVANAWAAGQHIEGPVL